MDDAEELVLGVPPPLLPQAVLDDCTATPGDFPSKGIDVIQ
jgi:hypothetical protein